MLHILFVILKILAIILASILGLLLFLLLIVLFVPIRYRADVRKYDEIIVKARVNWLLRIVFARVWFINQQLHLKLRIFGICIYDNLRPKKEKKPKKSSPNLKEKRVKRKETKKKETDKNKIYKKEKQQENNLEVDQKVDPKVDQIADQKKYQNIDLKIDQKVDQQAFYQEEHKADQKAENRVSLVNQKLVTQKSEIKTQIEESKLHDIEKTTQQEVTKSDIQISHESEEQLDIEIDQKLTRLPKRKGIFSKIKAFFGKIKTMIRMFFGLGGKIKSALTRMKAKLKSLSGLIKGLWEKKKKITSFLKNDINKAGIKMVFHQLLEVLKHCAPRKITGHVRYGTGDPCSTGETFAAAAFFYGKYGNSLRLVPDFEEEVLEAEVMVIGRIRIFTLLIIGIKLIRDKNFKKLLKNAKQLKEEL